MTLRRLFRSLDAKFVLSLAALLVVGTICYGFVQRGRHITAAESSVSALSSQLGDLSAENRRLRGELDQIQRKSTVRERQAARERDALLRELLRLNEFLRTNGIDVPAPTVYVTRTYTQVSPRPPKSPSSPPPSGGGDGGTSNGNGPRGGHGPGNSDGHSQGHGPKGGKGPKANRAGPLDGLPGLPILP